MCETAGTNFEFVQVYCSSRVAHARARRTSGHQRHGCTILSTPVQCFLSRPLGNTFDRPARTRCTFSIRWWSTKTQTLKATHTCLLFECLSLAPSCSFRLRTGTHHDLLARPLRTRMWHFSVSGNLLCIMKRRVQNCQNRTAIPTPQFMRTPFPLKTISLAIQFLWMNLGDRSRAGWGFRKYWQLTKWCPVRRKTF